MTEDAQRELEQRALRNVRGLVDRMEADETFSRRRQYKLLAVLAIVVVVALLAFLAIVSRKEPRGTEYPTTPKPGQVVPQGPKAPQ